MRRAYAAGSIQSSSQVWPWSGERCFTFCGLEEFLHSELDNGRQTDGYRPSAGDVRNERTNQKTDGDLYAAPILPLEVEKVCDR